jgi:hypothetical protein
MSDRAQIVAGPNYIVLAFRIGTVKNSKNFLRVDGPARVMMAPYQNQILGTQTHMIKNMKIVVIGGSGSSEQRW